MESMFKINFTDGTFWMVANSETKYSFPALTVTQIINVNTIIYGNGYIDGFQYGAFDYTKTDYDGNTWRFWNDNGDVKVSINNNVFNSPTSTELAFLTLKPSTGEIKMEYRPRTGWSGYEMGALPNGYGWHMDRPQTDSQYNLQYVYGERKNTMPTMSNAIVNIYGDSARTYVGLSQVGNNMPESTLFGSRAYQYFYYKNEKNDYPIVGTLLPGHTSSGYTVTLTEQSITPYDPAEPFAPPDPYDPVGDSSTGGGDGTFDGSSDSVDIPSVPTVGATNTGFISLFVPSEAQLRQVASYMWSNLFDISTFYKLFEDPMDCILGLSVVPVSVPTSGNAQITVGNIELSGITLPLASQQYVEVDCGSISFANKYFGSYLDYEPYTKMAIFLPYCGTHQINADDVMGKTVSVKYHIDILTGSCVAFVKCGDSVLYEYNGACASNIPVNSINYASTIENAIRIAVNIGTTVATAGASAPISGTTEALTTAQNIGRGISLAGSTAEGALSLKPNIARSGALGGSVGILGNQTPYIIITRPKLCKPKDQSLFEGYPSFIQTTIGSLLGKGFTSFTDIIISSQYLTDAEETELENILKGGVYL